MPIALHIAVAAASAPSHMHPHLAVVRELVERGHRVSYLVSSHLAHLAGSTGADVVGCTSLLPGAPVPGVPNGLRRLAGAGGAAGGGRVRHARRDGFVYRRSLWYAVPMVAIPQAVDQPLNTAQVEALGVGRHLTADPPGPADIRDAIRYAATDPDVRRRIDAIRDELHTVGGPVHAADAVEELANA